MKNFTRIFTLFLLTLFFSPLFGQKYYDGQWKKIEENYKTGKYKSNLPIILEIQKQAMKDDNANQLIRSLKAEFSIANQTRDDEKNDSVSQFFTKLSTFGDQLKGEQRLLYDVLLVEFFSDYYRNEAWEINQRTNINNQDFAQIETWSKLDFKNFLAQQFAKLEAKKGELQKVQLSEYKAIFEETQDLDYFPTLFEWNAVNQIEFLQNNDLFTPNERKVNYQKILAIYDELIQKNSGNSKLYFEHQKLNYHCGFINCKDRFTQLQNLVNSNTEGDYKVLIIAEMMDLLTAEQKFTEALTLAETAKKKYPNSKFADHIKNRENQIVNPALMIKFENHTQSNLPIHLVAEAKNVHQFSLNIYEVKDDFQNFMKYVSDSYNKNNFAAVKKSLVRKETFNLQDLR
ncbi:MAG: alpha-2-macroglobulin family protein, partial [Kaistella sp.]